MMRDENTQELQGARLPGPDAFREWLRDSVGVLGIAPAILSRRAGLSKNCAGRFVRDQGGDINLGSARALEGEILAEARAREITLRPLCLPGGET